jgi:hypothetical protein
LTCVQCESYALVFSLRREVSLWAWVFFLGELGDAGFQTVRRVVYRDIRDVVELETLEVLEVPAETRGVERMYTITMMDLAIYRLDNK